MQSHAAEGIQQDGEWTSPGREDNLASHKISWLLVSCQVTVLHAFTVYRRISDAHSSLLQQIDVPLPTAKHGPLQHKVAQHV